MIQLAGIVVSHFNVKRDDKGVLQLEGEYELKTNTGITVAKQGFNSYNGIKIPLSAETSKLLSDLLVAVSRDVTTGLGLNL